MCPVPPGSVGTPNDPVEVIKGKSCFKKAFLGRLGGSVGWASDFGSGHDLAVCEFEPASGSVLTAQSLEPASDSVPPSLSAPSPLGFCLSLSLKTK